MKTTLLLLFLALSSCSKDDKPQTALAMLPPETRIGANTFGCIINNQVFYPRDGVGNFGGGSPDKGIIFWGDPSGNRAFNEIDCGNFKDGKPASRIFIHLQGLHQTGVGEYIWLTTNFQNSIDGPMHNYVYARVYDALSNSWQYYGSYENSGKVTITRYELNNTIVSGYFSGKLKLKNGTQEIEILKGRFDINKLTLDSKIFP